MPKSEKVKAWDEFSKYIRTRDCIRTTNTLDTGVCCTCDREYPYKKLQAGHFLGGRSNSILLDEDVVHAQCYGCNIGKSGQYVSYFVWMEKTYGRDTIDQFIARKHVSLKMRDSDWIEKKEHYIKKRVLLVSVFNEDKYSQELLDLISLGSTL